MYAVCFFHLCGLSRQLQRWKRLKNLVSTKPFAYCFPCFAQTRTTLFNSRPPWLTTYLYIAHSTITVPSLSPALSSYWLYKILLFEAIGRPGHWGKRGSKRAKKGSKRVSFCIVVTISIVNEKGRKLSSNFQDLRIW